MMKKIAFITPWFGENIPGGAEMEARNLVKHLSDVGMDIEVLTTCVKEFNSNWNENYYAEGVYYVCGVNVRRFPVKKRKKIVFDRINAKLIQGKSIKAWEEKSFINQMINSTCLYDYIKKNKNEYAMFVFIPYMFGTTYYGIKACPEKSVMIPCFHDEAYFYMGIFKGMYSKVAGIIYNAKPECELVKRHYSLKNVHEVVMGIGMETCIEGNAERFRRKYNIKEPYILYAGRKDKNKNIYTLLGYYGEFKKRACTNLKLVLIGGGDVKIPSYMRKNIIDLGYVDIQDKFDACSGALFLCQPSLYESFSLVIMESWLCGRPVLVHGNCAVTKNFAVESNGGLYFSNYYEFESAVEFYLNNMDVAEKMGQNGMNYVKENFDWSNIIDKYIRFFEQINSSLTL